MIQFVQPWVLLLLIAVPYVGFLRWRRYRRDVVTFPPLQYRPGRAGSGAWWWMLAAAEMIATAVLVVAAAQPYHESRFERMDEEGIDIALVLDVSLSMLAEDFPPNRLAALRSIAGDFLDRSGGHRVGIYIFAGDTYVQSPLTKDRVALKTLLDSVSVHALNQTKGGGTAIGDALVMATERLQRQKVEGRDQAVILITDGESNLGLDPMLAARYLKRAEARLYAIGIGSETPQEVYFQGERVGGDTPFLAALDDESLRAMTAIADGEYFRATDADALGKVFGELSRLESAPLSTRTVIRKRTAAHRWALAGFLVLVLCTVVELAAMTRPWR